MKANRKSRMSINDYTNGVLSGDRFLLSRAITIIESNLNSDRKLADGIVEKILTETGNSIRIGITGAPGVGKSTFIETFGKFLTAQNKRVAVLAVDPSSEKTKGSILGDKTRMDELAKDSLAFIRPSPANLSLGGVTESTQETILLCEAAGFEVIIVETVGVGQSETIVRSMTDFFLLLMLPGSGDELQGIKKGVMEMADGLVITKSDGDNVKKSQQAQTDFQHAFHLFPKPESGIASKVLLTSSLEKRGFVEVWTMIEEFHKETLKNGFFKQQRENQNLSWFHSQINKIIRQKIAQQKEMKKEILQLEKKIAKSKISPGKASKKLTKKLKISFLLLLFCIHFSFAQNLSPAARRTPNINDLFNGMPFIKPESKVVGDIYINSSWLLTSIELKESEKPLEWHWTRYDIQADEMEIKMPTGIKVLKWNRINQFMTKDSSGAIHRFLSGANFKKEGVPLMGFMEVMVEGTRPLLKEYHLIVRGPNYNPALNAGSRDTEIRKDTDFYYSINGELMKISRSKKFIASLGDESSQVNNYMKTNNLSVKDEKDMILIFRYYNSLFQP
jgi:LAO/AO transport system kinase